LVFLFGIKRRSGGYHAATYGSCYLSTIGIYVGFVLVLAPFLEQHRLLTGWLLLGSVVVLEWIGAVNHPNMDWNDTEYVASKRATRKIVAAECGCIVVALGLGVRGQVIVFMAFAVILSAFLLLLAKIKKQEVSK
jgi:accessory gene regulator B